jgi:hypothetical protein
MALEVNHSGTWKTPTKVEVKDGGAWKEVLTGSIKDGGSWKEFYQRKFTYTVSSNVNKLDLDTVLSADNKLGDVDVIINSGVYVYSDNTSIPALLTGSGVAGVLTIINNGYIYGAGGAGGTGGSPGSGGSSGASGGTALKLEKNITLDNNGSILGGGGGGGGGGGASADQYFSDSDHAGGGGGGGGQSMGAGGSRNATCSGSQCNQASTNGAAGTITGAGSGGVGANVDGDAVAGNGGAGGAVGSSGSSGGGGSGNEGSGSGGGAGSAGTAIDDNSFTRTGD